MYRSSFQHLYWLERKRIAPTPVDDLRLHRLERPEPWEEELRELMWGSTPANLSNFYPDYSDFIRQVAKFALVPPEWIVLGQGIEGLVRDLFMLCCAPGDTVAYTASCKMFDVYAEVFKAHAHRILVDPEDLPTAEEIADSLPAMTKLLILPNPGQPVDLWFLQDELRVIATRCKSLGAVLAIDEAYLGFGALTALPLVEEFNNVVVLRTFSKAFGGAGLRVGYAIGGDDVIQPLDACRQSGEVSGPSMHAASVLMRHWASHVAPGILKVISGRNWLRDTLTADGFPATGNFANHVLVDMGSVGIAAAVADGLLARGVHVRTNEPPVDRYLMVTCGSIDLMQRFHAAFHAVVNGGA